LTDLTRFGYKVVLYDQMGCGKSERVTDPSILTVERHVEEVEGVRTALKLGKVHLFGNSWGGMLALAYALKYQRNLRSLLLSGALSSVPAYWQIVERQKSELPPKILKIIRKYEASRDYKNPEYINAAKAWYGKHILRLITPELSYSMEQCEGFVYQTMWGPNELVCIGALRYWDIRDRLHEIHVPCRVMDGKYDNVVPAIGKSICKSIKDAKFEFFKKSGHLIMWDEREKFTKLVASFIANL
jgi:proline iminopeptidase